MNKLSCTALAAVVGGLVSSVAFAEMLVDPTTPRIIPNDEAGVYFGMDISDIGAKRSSNSHLIRSGSDLGDALRSREFQAARTAVGDSYAFTYIRLANNPFVTPGNAAGYAPVVPATGAAIGAAPAEPQDPNFNDPDGIPFSGDETGDSPATQFLFNFDASTGFDVGEGRAQMGRDAFYLDLFVVEFEDELPDGNIFIQASVFSDDPGHGGDFNIPGAGFNIEDPNNPGVLQFSRFTQPRLDLGNNAFGDPMDFPEEGDPGWEDNMLQHGIVGGIGDLPGTPDVEGFVEFGFAAVKPGVALWAGGGRPATLLFSPSTDNDEFLLSEGSSPGSRNGLAVNPSDPNNELTAFIAYGFPGADSALGTDDDIPLGGYGIAQLSFFWELDPANASATPGACCVGGTATAQTITSCLNNNGTFFGVGSDPANINCPDCILTEDMAAADEASLIGFNDDVFATIDTYNGGCDVGGIFTPLDPNGSSSKGPASMGMDETVIGPKWQGTTGTRFIGGSFENDVDAYAFTPLSDGTLTVTASSEAPILVTVVAGDCGALFNATTVRVGDSTTDGNCTETFQAIVLGGVQHQIIIEVAPDVLFLDDTFNTSVTGSGNFGYEFQATLGALQTGACVTVDACTQQTLFDCLDVENGLAFNSGTTCADIIATNNFCPDVWTGVTVFENETEIFVDTLEPTIVEDTFNGGFCDMADNVIATPISAGVTVGGETSLWLFDGPTVFADDIVLVNIFQRDVDAYSYSHTGGTLNVDIQAQFAAQVDILNVTCVGGTVTGTIEAGDILRDLINPNSITTCDMGNLAVDLPAGDYIVRVTNDLDDTASAFEGFSTPSRYALTVSSIAACIPCNDTSRSDGDVNISDLLDVIGTLGQSGNFPGDTNCSGAVDITDLLNVIGNLGTTGVVCP